MADSFRLARPSRRLAIQVAFGFVASVANGAWMRPARTASAIPDLSGFPDASTTGVAKDIALKPAAGFTIGTPGTIIEGLDISGPVVITASKVTLRNCKVTAADHNVVLIKPEAADATVENCEIDNRGSGGQGIAGHGVFLRNNIHDCADGIDVRGDDTIIQDNFIHQMRGTSQSHFDGIQADGNFSNLTIVHNTVINEQNQTSALMLDNYWGPIDRVIIDNNLLIGGGYTVYINEVAKGQPGGGPVTNVSFTNNRLGRGYWGLLDLRTELGNRPIIKGNVDARTGAALAGQRGGASPVGQRK